METVVTMVSYAKLEFKCILFFDKFLLCVLIIVLKLM